jgi:hypothetical protein
MPTKRLNPRPRRKPETCEPFSKVIVSAFAPGTLQETVKCTSDADFLVYCVTNGGGAGFSINVKSTGFGTGVDPSVTAFTIGASAGDVITFIFQPGAAGFLTLQTQCDAKASISG